MLSPIHFTFFERTPENRSRPRTLGELPEASQDSWPGSMFAEAFNPTYRASRQFRDGVLVETGEPDTSWRARHVSYMPQFPNFFPQFQPPLPPNRPDAAGRIKSWIRIMQDALGNEHQVEAREQMQLYKPGN